MRTLFLITLLVFFSGCAVKEIEKKVIVNKTVYKLIKPKTELTKRIDVPAPMGEEYADLNAVEREGYLVGYSIQLLEKLDNANYKLKSIRVFNYLNERRLREKK